MPSVTRGQTVPVSALQIGPQLGSGGQGHVFALTNHPDLVFKRYLFPNINVAALNDLVALPGTLPPREAAQLLDNSAWPLATVHNGSVVEGFLMPRVPADFIGHTPAGPKLRELQFLLYAPKPLWGDITPLDIVGRFTVVTKFAMLLKLLHQHKVVLGDISMNNVLWSPGADPRIFLLDCDGAKRVNGDSPLPQPGTPDWDDPLCPSIDSDLDSDAYKLALLVGRVLAASADLRPGQMLALPGELPDRMAATAVSYFGRAAGPRGSRPTAAEWFSAITTGRGSIPLPAPPPMRQPPVPQQPLTPLEGAPRQRGSIPLPPVPKRQP